MVLVIFIKEKCGLVTGPRCHCNVRAGEIKFVFQHISLPANFLNFNYKFFWIDRFLANSGNKEIIVIKTLNSELAACCISSIPLKIKLSGPQLVLFTKPEAFQLFYLIFLKYELNQFKLL